MIRSSARAAHHFRAAQKSGKRIGLDLDLLLQDVFIQSMASEQSARVMAMQAASDNAKELLDELQLEYNKLRQQGITTELLDILGGQVER